MQQKQRLDILLQQKNPHFSRRKIQSYILQAKVLVNGEIVEKPGFLVNVEATIELQKDAREFVSRGGSKLQKAFDLNWITAQRKICADIGASTGGFTDCLLQHGTQRVYAIDVGYGQLAQKLRNDPRVVVMEKTNVRYVEKLPKLIDVIVIDVSFISLRLVLPVVRNWLKKSGAIIALFKPQFEAGKILASKTKGVIKNSTERETILNDFKQWLTSNTFTIEKQTESPIKGQKGNVEYLLLIKTS